jgi:hypothetical protein
MHKTKLTSALGFISFAISIGLFSLGIRTLDSLYICTLIFIASLITLVFSFVVIGSLRCEYCGKKLGIVPFPSYNPIGKFFLWTAPNRDARIAMRRFEQFGDCLRGAVGSLSPAELWRDGNIEMVTGCTAERVSRVGSDAGRSQWRFLSWSKQVTATS